MIANAGLSSYDATMLLDRIRRNTPTGEEMTCSVCYDTKDFADCFALGCDHWFCKDCYSNSLEATLETTGCSTKCIANGMVLSGGHKVQCNERVVPLVYRELPLVLLANCDSSRSHSLFEMATSSAGGGGASSSYSSNSDIASTPTSLRTYNDRYRMKVVRNLIENNPSSMTYCPGLDCEMVAVGSEVTKVVCSCGTRYCFKCKEPDHEPCSCDNYKSWKVRANEEGLNVLWINENTQRCPKLGCNNPIEKNGGCDWIRCKCRHEFCWICDSEWFNHTTVRHPNCPGMKVRVLGGASPGINAQTDNHLFSYCFTRYKLHQNCEKHAMEGLEKFQKQCESLTEGDIQVDFTHMEKEDIKNAWKLVSKCRSVLTFAYVFIYYQSKEALEKQEKTAVATSPKASLNGGNVFALGRGAPNSNQFLPPAAPPPAAAAAFLKKTTTLPSTTASSMVNDNQTFISNPLFDEQLKMLERQTEKLQGFIERKINSPHETRQYMLDIYNHNELLTRYIDSLVKSVQVDL